MEGWWGVGGRYVNMGLGVTRGFGVVVEVDGMGDLSGTGMWMGDEAIREAHSWRILGGKYVATLDNGGKGWRYGLCSRCIGCVGRLVEWLEIVFHLA